MALLLALAAGAGGCSMSQRSGSWLGAEPKPAAILVEVQDRAAFEEGIALAADLKYAEAQAKFRQVLAWYRATNDRARTAETLFWLGYCCEKQGRSADARDAYVQLVREHPSLPAARQASARLRRLPPEKKKAP